MRVRALLAVPLAAVALSASVPLLVADGASARQAAAGPLVFGHRGASGYRPEHTLASYDLAVRQGADVIEPDLVSTKDGVLVARHENEIGGTTDVATKFASRRTTKVIDGVSFTGWFTEDLTLAELKTLRAKERLPLVRQENTILDGRYEVPTLREVLEYALAASKRYGRTIGVAPETKHPTYFDGLGLSLEEPLLAELRRAGLDKAKSPVYVQSFETANLRELAAAGVAVDLVQLTAGPDEKPYDLVVARDPRTYRDLTTPAGLRDIATYADVLGPPKGQVVRSASAGAPVTPTTLVEDAHRAGLEVVPYTVRAENQFLPPQYRKPVVDASGQVVRDAQGRPVVDPTAYGDVLAELRDLYATGIDGIFADQPDLARQARDGS